MKQMQFSLVVFPVKSFLKTVWGLGKGIGKSYRKGIREENEEIREEPEEEREGPIRSFWN